jgi:hypothetical protein
MEVFKIVLWLIMACFFASLVFYSLKGSKDFKRIKQEIDTPTRLRTYNADFVFTEPYAEVFTSFYSISRISFIIGGIGLLLSAFAAIFSALM